MRILGVFLLHLILISPIWAERLTPCFTPQQNCTLSIVQCIEHAQKEILVQAYSFTSADISEALLHAQERGIKVRILLDKSQRHDKHSKSTKLTKAGMDVKIDEVPGIAHNKVMIIDEFLVITGSFNFTHAAQHRNSENVLFIESRDIALEYKKNWINRAQTAKPYTTKGERTPTKKKKIKTGPHVKAMRNLLKKIEEE